MLAALIGLPCLIPVPYNARLVIIGVHSWKAVSVHLG